MDRIKLIVLNENTLGQINPETPERIEVFRASLIKHSRMFNYNGINNFKIHKSDIVRLATKEDFNTFSVSSEYYFDHPNEYEFLN